MYFNNKTYYSVENNMSVMSDQINNKKPRRKGVRKKVKKKGGKVDMKKLKTLFGSDIIVKLLLSLVDKQSRGPNLKSQSRKELGEGKSKGKKMRRAKGGNFQTGAALKKERDKKDKELRVAQASIKKPGESNEDVSLRMMKEVIAGDNPAVAAFLQANQIPPELRRLQGNLAVLGEAYFDSKATSKDKKAIERNILKQVIQGIGGDVRKDFLTGIEETEAVAGITEAVELLKKETGLKDPEKIIQQKDKITKDIQKKVEKGKISEEQGNKVLDGLDAVEELKTTDKNNIEEIITDDNISNLETKKKGAGRKKESPDVIRKNLIDYMELKNPTLQTDKENREFFLSFIDDEIGKGKKKGPIKNLLDTQIKKLAEGKLGQEPIKKVKKTRADAGIFVEGAIVGEPDAFNITIGATGERKKFDLFEVNRRAKFVRDELDKFDNSLSSDLITSKNKKSFEKEIEGHRQEFRNQLKAKAESRDYDLKPDYTKQTFTPDEIADDIQDLVDDFKMRGIGLPNFKLYKGESIYGYGGEGITLKNTIDNTYRYIDYKQSNFRKDLDKIRKEEKKEEKILRQAGNTSFATTVPDSERLVDELNPELKEKYKKGILTGTDLNQLNPRLQLEYKDYVKVLEKQLKSIPKGQGAIVPVGVGLELNKPGFFKSLFAKKVYQPVIEKEKDTLGFTSKGEEITEDTFKKATDTGNFDSLFDVLDTSGGKLLDAPPIPKKDSILLREDFKTDDEFFQYTTNLPKIGTQSEFGGFVPNIQDIPITGTKSQTEKSKIEERKSIMNKVRNNQDIEPSEYRKLTKPNRKRVGLLTDTEISELSVKEQKRYEGIKNTLEANIQARSDNNPLSEPEVSVEEDIPSVKRKATTPQRPKKVPAESNELGDVLSTVLGSAVSEEENKRREETLEKLRKQQEDSDKGNNRTPERLRKSNTPPRPSPKDTTYGQADDLLQDTSNVGAFMNDLKLQGESEENEAEIQSGEYDYLLEE
mgnify:CR=1 FL=1